MIFRIVLFIGLIFTTNVGIFAQKAKTKSDPIKVGAIAPDFSLTTNKKDKVTLSKVKKKTVLVFYRGYW